MRPISRVASSECPPSSKKLSSMPTCREPQRLGKQTAQHLLVRRARQTPQRRHGRLRRRQRPPVELAVRRQRQPIQQHERRRHHVVRQQPDAQMRPQRRSIRRRRAVRRHHIRHQPQRTAAAPPALRRSVRRNRHRVASVLAGIRTAVAARHHGGLRHARMPLERRLDLARLDAEAAQLHLRVRPPQEVQHPIGPPARQVAGAVHPAARRPERVGHKPLRRQSRTPQIAPRQTRTRNVQLTAHTHRNRTQTASST